MSPGTMYILIKFPTQWPPSTPQVLLDSQDRGTQARLVVSTTGRPQLELQAKGESQIHRFQTIRPSGSGYAALAVAWGEGSASLFVNGLEVRALGAAGEEVLDIPLREQPTPVSPGIHFAEQMLQRMTGEERLFLESLRDLEQRLAVGTPYELLMASGILRKLLLEEDPLVHQVNQHYGVQLRFLVLRRSDPLPSGADDPELHFMALLPDGAPSIKVTEKQLWQHTVLEHRDVRFNAREVVQAAAHVLGGIHKRKPKTEAEHRIVDLAERIRAMRTPLPLYAIRDIALVVIAGLLSVAKEIADKYR